MVDFKAFLSAVGFGSGVMVIWERWRLAELFPGPIHIIDLFPNYIPHIQMQSRLTVDSSRDSIITWSMIRTCRFLWPVPERWFHLSKKTVLFCAQFNATNATKGAWKFKNLQLTDQPTVRQAHREVKLALMVQNLSILQLSARKLQNVTKSSPWTHKKSREWATICLYLHKWDEWEVYN